MEATYEGLDRKGRLALGAIASVAAVVLVLALPAGSARADVGVTAVSRHGGEPGDGVRLTLTCGFCFPPCEGPKGHRHPKGFDRGPCMLGTKQDPPSSFGISLIPLAKAVDPAECRRQCPRAPRPPRRAPYRYLGEAVPPPGGNNPEHGDPPRYLLDFEIPRLAPGAYTYVIWCDVCLRGREGALLSFPASPLWRLHVR